MDHKQKIALGIFAFGVTFTLFVVRMRGTMFQASLISEEADPNSYMLTSDISIREFPIHEENTALYQNELTKRDDGNVGFYLSKIYNAPERGEGAIALGYKGIADLDVEQNIEIELRYPYQAVTYIGNDEVQEFGYRAAVANNVSEGILTIQFFPRVDGTYVLPKDTEEFLLIPFALEENAKVRSPLRFQITGVKTIAYNGSESTPRFLEGKISSLFVDSEDAGAPSGASVETTDAVEQLDDREVVSRPGLPSDRPSITQEVETSTGATLTETASGSTLEDSSSGAQTGSGAILSSAPVINPDVNNDGVVDSFDLSLFLNAYQQALTQ